MINIKAKLLEEGELKPGPRSATWRNWPTAREIPEHYQTIDSRAQRKIRISLGKAIQ